MISLDVIEQRVLGALIEKELCTPEYYPLTLNALTAACNQKSNRDPVMTLEERQVRGAMDGLIAKDVAWQRFAAGSRVPKYAHKFSDTLSKVIEFNKLELAILAELLLRGPQTPGELRAHAGRMVPFGTVEDVERVLQKLATRADGPYVVELPRSPGKRESRYMQLLGGSAMPAMAEVPTSAPAFASGSGAAGDRLDGIERELADLRAEIANLKSQLAELAGQSRG